MASSRLGPAAAAGGDEAGYEIASQRQLIWRKFRRHRVAVFSFYLLLVLYALAILAEFCSPYGAFERHRGYLFAPPTKLHFIDQERRFHLRPFVYKVTNEPTTEVTVPSAASDRPKRADITAPTEAGGGD